MTSSMPRCRSRFRISLNAPAPATAQLAAHPQCSTAQLSSAQHSSAQLSSAQRRAARRSTGTWKQCQSHILGHQPRAGGSGHSSSSCWGSGMTQDNFGSPLDAASRGTCNLRMLTAQMSTNTNHAPTATAPPTFSWNCGKGPLTCKAPGRPLSSSLRPPLPSPSPLPHLLRQQLQLLLRGRGHQVGVALHQLPQELPEGDSGARGPPTEASSAAALAPSGAPLRLPLRLLQYGLCSAPILPPSLAADFPNPWAWALLRRACRKTEHTQRRAEFLKQVRGPLSLPWSPWVA